jgi:hypothetical protein
MTDILAAQFATLPTVTFAPSSRYSGVETTTIVDWDGRVIIYLRRRFVPQPERLALLYEHSVSYGERLDLIAARAFGDPELFWRICDANRALRPEDLTSEIGHRLRITLPEGVPGLSNG